MTNRFNRPALAAALFAAGLAGAASLPASAQDLTADTAAARAIVKDFGTALRGELGAAMQKGGPMAAIAVCNTRAPALAKEKSAASGWDVARTSLRLRNPADAPDAWEVSVLEEFDARLARGEQPDAMEKAAVVTTGGKTEFRYMKPLPVGEVCLTCHGKDVAPDLLAEIRKHYPDDKATGYDPGQIRGAFTLRKPM